MELFLLLVWIDHLQDSESSWRCQNKDETILSCCETEEKWRDCCCFKANKRQHTSKIVAIRKNH